MKTINLKSVMQTLLFCIILMTSLVIGKNIYHNIQQIYESQPTGSGVSCFFEMMD